MRQLEDIRNDTDLMNSIDWEMTHEEAVRLYLEWGNNWTRGNYVIRSKADVSYYFVVNTWENEPAIYLMRRNSDEALELARIEMPKDVADSFLESVGYNKGVYSITGPIKEWLRDLLAAD
ncbi:MAG: DVU0772 family protein [Thermodesulfobacteriota bacterium]